MIEKIIEKMDHAIDSVKLVEENLPQSYKGFISMKKLERDGIYKNVEFAIQNILDICAMILKEKDLKVPASDKDMLEELSSSGIMSKRVIEKIKEMKGFRNYLVHRYGYINDRTAFNNIRPGLKDFHKIFDEIKKIIS